MTTFDEFLKEFPPGSRKKVEQAWNALPEVMRLELEALILSVPIQPQLLRRLIDISLRQFKTVAGKKRKIVIIGPANVGKSTLYNQLIRSKADRAEVGPLPGTTRVNQEADAGFFSLVDTPGADAVGEVGEAEKQQAPTAARQADFIILVFDAIQGIKKTEQELFEELTALEKPFLVGHSMGATVLMIANALHGLSAAGMVLIEPILLPAEFYRGSMRVDEHPLAARAIRRTNFLARPERCHAVPPFPHPFSAMGCRDAGTLHRPRHDRKER